MPSFENLYIVSSFQMGSRKERIQKINSEVNLLACSLSKVETIGKARLPCQKFFSPDLHSNYIFIWAISNKVLKIT